MMTPARALRRPNHQINVPEICKNGGKEVTYLSAVHLNVKEVPIDPGFPMKIQYLVRLHNES
jgi:hypothetical protein